MPAIRPRWPKIWLWYVGWSGIAISSHSEEIVKDPPENTKITQIAEIDAESRLEGSRQLSFNASRAGCNQAVIT
jgi:hypothetical protein